MQSHHQRAQLWRCSCAMETPVGVVSKLSEKAGIAESVSQYCTQRLVCCCCRKAACTSSGAPSSFEASLGDYVNALKLPAQAATRARGIIADHDFSSARAHLVPSVPGYHTGNASSVPLFRHRFAGVQDTNRETKSVVSVSSAIFMLQGLLQRANIFWVTCYYPDFTQQCQGSGCLLAGDHMRKYGHMRVRDLLKQEDFSNGMRHAPLVAQFLNRVHHAQVA